MSCNVGSGLLWYLWHESCNATVNGRMQQDSALGLQVSPVQHADAGCSRFPCLWGFLNTPHIPHLPTGHSVGSNKATMPPTLERFLLCVILFPPVLMRNTSLTPGEKTLHLCFLVFSL